MDNVRERVEECDGIDHLEALQQHESEVFFIYLIKLLFFFLQFKKIYTASYQIIDEFFSEEEEEKLDEFQTDALGKQNGMFQFWWMGGGGCQNYRQTWYTLSDI